ECGFDQDTIDVSLVITPLVDLGVDTTLCDETEYFIDPLPGLTGIYDWSTGSADTAITVTNDGLYWLEVTNYCGIHRDSVTVLFRTTPQVDLGADTILCDSVYLTLDAGWPFVSTIWSTGSTDSAITVTDPGLYWAEISNYCGIVRDTINVYLQYTPFIDAGPDTLLCNQANFTIDPVTVWGYYLWSDNSTDSTLIVTQTGDYWVTLSNFCGSASDSVETIFKETPVVNLGADTLYCDSVDAILSAGYPECSYLWNTSDTTLTIYTDTAGIFWVTATNECGYGSDTIQLFLLPTPYAALPLDTVLCSADSFNIVHFVGPFDYLWNTGDTTTSINVTETDNYWLQISNGCGVSADSMRIWFKTTPYTNLGHDTTYCGVDSVVLDAGHLWSYYIWNDASTDSTLTVDTTGTYFVIVSNECGADSDTVALRLLPIPFVDLGADTILCGQDSGVFYLIPNVYSALWSTGDTTFSTTVYETGIIWAQLSNDCGFDEDSLMVTFLEYPFVQLQDDSVLCEQDFLTLLPTIYDTSCQYVWNTGETNHAIQISGPGEYILTATNYCGSDADSVLITEILIPTPDLGADTAYCNFDSVLFVVPNNGDYYLWSNNSTNDSMYAYISGQYWVYAENQCGNGSDTANIVLSYSPVFTLGPDTAICKRESIELWVNNPGVTVVWNDGIVSPMITVDDAGYYWADVTNIYSCTTRDSVFVAELDIPWVFLPADTLICLGEILELSPISNMLHYTWCSGEEDMSMEISQTGNYCVYATNQCGTGYDTISVQYYDCSCQLYIPTAFSPNGDQVNDVLYVRGMCDDFLMMIFDRWGQKVFETRDISTGWDGTFNGKVLNTSVFNFVIIQQPGTDFEKVIKGDISLIR
ncbi:MAG: gliding motility-associated C-terminal domain-containing protein, partial [Bacteroidetes bacterium]|nr:gliding motility-associated C-terminal domain-containing protein [Bacteroidota bacterium]